MNTETRPDEPASNLAEYTVTEIAFALKRTLEETFGYVRVRGEISGYRGPHASGHCYFTLKDASACLDAVVWRTAFARMRGKLQEGLEVIATGRISSYPNSSKYQIIVESVEPAGVGALMALLEERKRRLAAEGLFEAARKRPIPYLPRVIGVVTSPTGAVIRDILHRLADRFPRHVLVWPVRVQGETCAEEVAAAIRGFNALEVEGTAPRPDLIIVARGGGSLEDLWGFNDEVVVRAAAASAIPLISAVGHETDWTLLDLVADERAPTPTAAAERAVPVRADLATGLADLALRMRRATGRLLAERRTRVRSAARGLPRPDDVLALARQRHDAVAGRLAHALKVNLRLHRLAYERGAGRLNVRPIRQGLHAGRERVARERERAMRALARLLSAKGRELAARSKLLGTLSYRAVLERGFALVRDEERKPILSASQTRPGRGVSIEFHDGAVEAVIGRAGRPAPSGRQGGNTGSQGSLF